MGMVAQTASVYITVVVTIERWLAVCFPIRGWWHSSFWRMMNIDEKCTLPSWCRAVLSRAAARWQRVEWQLKLNMRRAVQLGVHGDRGDTRAEAEDAQESAASFSR